MKKIIASSIGLLLLGSVLVIGSAHAGIGFESGQNKNSTKSNKNTNTGNTENGNQNKTVKKKPTRH